MAFVQSAVSTTAPASGVAGASLTGVVANHGLVCFVLYETVATSQTLTDSAGTTWVPVGAITLAGAAATVFLATQPVVAGTHTITASFVGGSGAWSYLIEDTNSVLLAAGARTVAGPGTGNSLGLAASIGFTNSPVYQVAIDNSHSAASYKPTDGTFAPVSVSYSSSDAAIGAWVLSGNDTAGGTTPKQAVGASDPSGLDTYGILAFSFSPTGMVLHQTQQIVLVEDPQARWQKRFPYEVFGQVSAPLRPTPISLQYPKPIIWEFYRDRFTGVYPADAIYSRISSTYYSIQAATGVYAYSGQSANFTYAAHHSYIIFGAPANYNYDGAFSTADWAISGNTGVYSYQGGIALFPGSRRFILTPVPASYSYTGGQATLINFVVPIVGTLQGLILTTSTRIVLGPKRAGQVVAPPFDFSVMTVPGDVLTSPLVTITVWSGVDANPQFVFGGSLIIGNIVYVTFQGGLPGVIYQVHCQVSASLSGILSIDAFLAVLPSGL